MQNLVTKPGKGKEKAWIQWEALLSLALYNRYSLRVEIFTDIDVDFTNGMFSIPLQSYGLFINFTDLRSIDKPRSEHEQHPRSQRKHDAENGSQSTHRTTNQPHVPHFTNTFCTHHRATRNLEIKTENHNICESLYHIL